MKKIFLIIIIFLINITIVQAENFPHFKYGNIKNKEKISYNLQKDTWSKKADKNGTSFIKTKGFGDFFDYLDADKNFAFTTDCEYEFIYKGKFIGYSNNNLNFYEIILDNGNINKRLLSKAEVEKIFPDYKVICLSEFSDKTNAIKIKKHIGNLKLILYNDVGKTFEQYTFSSGNAKFQKYDLNGFVTVEQSGMIQFAKVGEHDYKHWYIILVR